jgi:hypothetical protein
VKMMKIDRLLLKRSLRRRTLCIIQHDGWTCGTCFFSMSKSLTNADWQNVLLIRGDHKKTDLKNLPKDRLKSYKKVLKCCGVN